jgi:hypothetical protein
MFPVRDNKKHGFISLHGCDSVVSSGAGSNRPGPPEVACAAARSAISQTIVSARVMQDSSRRNERQAMARHTTKAPARERLVEISAGHRKVGGILRIPPEPDGMVAFAHGSGSGRFSSRNQFVAQVLEDSGLVTLLIDLLEENEAQHRRKVFDIALLAERLRACSPRTC